MGIILSVLAAFFWGIGALYAGQATRYANASVAGFWTLFPGVALMAAAALALGHFEAIGTLDTLQWMLLVGAGALHFAIGRMSYFEGIRAIGAGRGSALGFTYTMWGPLFGILLLREELSLQLVLGTALVFLGILVVTQKTR